MIVYQQQVEPCPPPLPNQPPCIPPLPDLTPWDLWFESLDWLDPLLGIPMDGYITGLWLMWGDSSAEMVDIITPLPSIDGLPGMQFGFLPHEVHGFIDVFTLMNEFQVTDANLLPDFELFFHTHHIPEPSSSLIFFTGLFALFRRYLY